MEMKRGYKQTEVGVIPEEWVIIPFIRAVSSYIDYRGRTPRKLGLSWGGGDILALSANNVQMGRIDPDKEAYLGSEELYRKWMVQGECQKGDVLLTMEAPLGNVAQIPDSRRYILSQRVLLIKPKDWLLRDFLAHYMKGLFFQSQLSQNSTGSTAKGIQRRKLDDLRVYIPPTQAEQEAIAGALSDAGALIDSLEQLITKKRRLKQGAMQELLTGKKRLPGFATPKAAHCQTRFGTMPEDWVPRTLADVAAFITKGSTPTTYGFAWRDTGVLFLRSECVSERGLDLAQSMFIAPEAHRLLRRSEVHGGDILMTITGNVGRVVHFPVDFGEANINQHIARIRIVHEDVASLFVFHFLSQPLVRRYYSLITTGQAYPQISLNQVRETELPMPTLAEQTAIATILTTMDAEIAALESKLAKARHIKQGMMHNLLTGRIRLV